ncbi:MAG: transcription elongation factor GreA [Candidatus Omnitrophica bacterium]|nr:transcription elongation factor GreA [Candidatus Omnitrophota bacterium]
MSQEVYLTRAGYEKLRDELEELKGPKRHAISKVIGEARLLGDLKENAEYHAAKEEQGHCEARIANLELKLSNVRLIEDQNISADKVFIGAIVTLKDCDTDEKMKYMMVSPEEANYEENKLSILSPIGKGLMGHEAGEELEVQVPAGSLRYKILKIERP